MDTREIETALKGRIGPHIHYKGIYTCDHLPIITYNSKPIIFIANTLSSTSPVTKVGHWVAFYISFNPIRKLVFYDSYGLSPYLYTFHFSKYIHQHYNAFDFYYFNVQLQPDTSYKCGLYVINLVHYTSQYGLEKYIS